MLITKVYNDLQIPKHLQKHMLRVAAVGQFLAQNWNDQSIMLDDKSIIKTLLLHDLGNLLKFDLNRGIELFHHSERDVGYWKKVQHELSIKYDPDEHKATYSMAKNVGVSDRVLHLLSNMGSSNLQQTLESSDWELKVCSYSDFRVGPHGYLTVRERFDDILDRYKGREHALADEQKTRQKMERCLLLEQQLKPNLQINLAQLPEDELEKQASELSDFQF